MQNQKFIINTEMFCDKVSNQKFTQDEGDLFDEYFDPQSDHDDVQNVRSLGVNLDHVENLVYDPFMYDSIKNYEFTFNSDQESIVD